MPGAQALVDQLVDGAVPGNQIVGADLEPRIAQRAQCIGRAVLAGVMQNNLTSSPCLNPGDGYSTAAIAAFKLHFAPDDTEVSLTMANRDQPYCLLSRPYRTVSRRTR